MNRRAMLSSAAWIVVLALVGAGPPEIKRVHANAKKAAAFFPAGSQFRILSVPEFEQLAADALAGSRSAPRSATPRLLRAEHRARLDGALLSGETTLYFDAAASSSGFVEIKPWTPALAVDPKSTSPIVNTDDGRFFVRLGPSTENPVRVSWTLRARTGSDGDGVFPQPAPRRNLVAPPRPPRGDRPRRFRRDPPGPGRGRFSGASALAFRWGTGSIDLRLRKTSAAGALENRPGTGSAVAPRSSWKIPSSTGAGNGPSTSEWGARARYSWTSTRALS